MTSMNARTEMSVALPSPQLKAVRALKDHYVKVSWRAGSRTGRVEIVDLSPLINSFKYYRPVREPAEFKTIHLIDDGFGVAWGDDAVEMASTAIERLAEETLSSDDFRKFLTSNKLTHGEAAAVLGRGRRQIENY